MMVLGALHTARERRSPCVLIADNFVIDVNKEWILSVFTFIRLRSHDTIPCVSPLCWFVVARLHRFYANSVVCVMIYEYWIQFKWDIELLIKISSDICENCSKSDYSTSNCFSIRKIASQCGEKWWKYCEDERNGPNLMK